MYVFINRIKFKANITSANLIIFFLNSNQSFIKTQKILNSNNFLPKSTTSVSTYTQKNNHIKQAPSPTKQQHQQAPTPNRTTTPASTQPNRTTTPAST